MPIPTPDEELGPRVLLRDVAFNKLLTAIQDGTLLPGERLNDVDLTKWIGVSRTPIREALSRLELIGLIDTAANRYTRIANPTPEVLEESVDLLIGYGELAARLALPKLGGTDADELFDLLDALVAESDDAKGSIRALSDVIEFFLSKIERPILATTVFETTQLALFSAGAGLSTPAFDAASFDRDLRSALSGHDATAASDAFRGLAQSFEARSASR